MVAPALGAGVGGGHGGGRRGEGDRAPASTGPCRPSASAYLYDCRAPGPRPRPGRPRGRRRRRRRPGRWPGGSAWPTARASAAAAVRSDGRRSTLARSPRPTATTSAPRPTARGRSGRPCPRSRACASAARFRPRPRGTGPVGEDPDADDVGGAGVAACGREGERHGRARYRAQPPDLHFSARIAGRRPWPGGRLPSCAPGQRPQQVGQPVQVGADGRRRRGAATRAWRSARRTTVRARSSQADTWCSPGTTNSVGGSNRSRVLVDERLEARRPSPASPTTCPASACAGWPAAWPARP